MSEGRGRRRARNRLRTGWFWRTALLNVAALLGVVCLVSTIAVLALGLKPIAFSSDSMSPAISSGDLALTKNVPAGDIGVGDVVSVDDRSGQRVTHRVVSVQPFGNSIRLTLKADAAGAPDVEAYEVTSADKVVTVIPWAGHVVGSPIGLAVAAVFVAALAVVLFIPRRRLQGMRRAAD